MEGRDDTLEIMITNELEQGVTEIEWLMRWVELYGRWLSESDTLRQFQEGMREIVFI